jgi:ABC-2 type transport system ATP-binding protein
MMGEAEKMADEIVLIHQGKVVLEGKLDEVRTSFGENTLHLEFDGDGAFLRDLPTWSDPRCMRTPRS